MQQFRHLQLFMSVFLGPLSVATSYLMCYVRWWSMLAGPGGSIILPHRPQESQQETHLLSAELLETESQAFPTGLSILWNDAISEMFLIPQLYQD